MTAPILVSDLSETELLAQIQPLLPFGDSTLVGPGDDCAVVAAADSRYVVTTDVLVENHHFRREWSTGYDVGWRAAMQNFADVVAMGATPTTLVVGLVLPADLPVAWVLDFARGLAAACTVAGTALGGAASAESGMAARPGAGTGTGTESGLRATPGPGIVGGDLSGGPCIMAAITAHGDLGGAAPVLRSGARPGDVVAYAGRRGWSAAGLALLEAMDPAKVRPALMPLVDFYRRPDPPLAAGPAAAAAKATAMIDVSDGLVLDAGRLAWASKVRVDLELDAFLDDTLLNAAAQVLATHSPRPGELESGRPRGAQDHLGAEAWAARKVQEWVLAGGEDHGLLATFPPDVPLPAPFRRVGTVLSASVDDGGSGTALINAALTNAVLIDGGPPPIAAGGWDHFAS